MTTKEDLYRLIDLLPEWEWEAVRQTLLEHLAEPDEVTYDLFEAPEDDPTPDEIAAIEEYEAELREGRVKMIPHAEVVKYLLELP
jgi:hypothetical protein